MSSHYFKFVRDVMNWTLANFSSGARRQLENYILDVILIIACTQNIRSDDYIIIVFMYFIKISKWFPYSALSLHESVEIRYVPTLRYGGYIFQNQSDTFATRWERNPVSCNWGLGFTIRTGRGNNMISLCLNLALTQRPRQVP